MTYGGFSVPFANKIADIIDAVETGDQYLAESDFRVSQHNTYYVVLDEDLAAPDDKSTPTTAVATVYKPGADGTVGEDGYSSTPHKLDVVNRFTGYSASEGDFIVVEEQDGEYRPSGAGGGGSGSCSACCTSVRTGNMLHPDLPTGYDETTRDWSFTSSCGGAIEAIEIPNAAGSLRLVWAGGMPTGTYEDTDDTFTVDISADCTILDATDTDVTGSTSFTATITMDFVTRDVVISWDEV